MNSDKKIILSIIIVNYNGMKFLEDCLNSIKHLVSVPHEVIIVDNASTDKSCEYLERTFPETTLIKNEKNLGFSAGNNIGVKKALGEYVLLLNNDTLLRTDLKVAIDIFAKNEKLGVLGGRLFYGNGSLQFSLGYEHTPSRIIFSWLGLGSFSKAPEIFKQVETNPKFYEGYQSGVDWVSGAFFFTRKSLWEELGGFDEKYFMYVEEVDFCKRVELNGNEVAFTPEVEVTHFHAGGKAWVGERAMINTINSYLIYLEKFHSTNSITIVKLCLVLIFALRFIAFGVLSVLTNSTIKKEKTRAFFKIFRRLLAQW